MATTFTTNYGFDKPAISDLNWGGARNTNMDDVDAELFKPRIGQTAPTVGATTTLDLSVARVFVFTVTQITTIAFSNVPSTFPNGAVVPAVRIWLKITNGSAFAVTWPASIVWPNLDTDPFLTISGVDWVELLTVDGGTTWYGSVLHQKDPRPAGRMSGGTQTITDSTDTAVSFTTEVLDVGGMVDIAGQPTRMTIPAGRPGRYYLHGQVRYVANATGTRIIEIKKNGGAGFIVFKEQGNHSGTVNFINDVGILVDAVGGDYFQLYVKQTSGGNLNIANGPDGAPHIFFEAMQVS